MDSGGRSKHFRRELARLKVDTFGEIFTTERGEPLLRLFWFVVFLFSTNVCVFLVEKSVQEYIKYEVTTTIQCHRAVSGLSERHFLLNHSVQHRLR